MFHANQTPVRNFLLKLIERRNGIDPTTGTNNISNELSLKRKEIDDHVKSHEALKEERVLYEKFVEYDKMLGELILVKRVESGVSILLFLLYSILTGVAGMIMELLALLTTTGLLGHFILSLSIVGGVIGVIFALYSLRKERRFIVALRDGF